MAASSDVLDGLLLLGLSGKSAEASPPPSPTKVLVAAGLTLWRRRGSTGGKSLDLEDSASELDSGICPRGYH